MINVPLTLLAAAIPGSQCSGRPDVLVRRITTDSRDVHMGDLFACVRGKTVDGHAFAQKAVQRGAAAVIVDRPVKGLDLNSVGVIRVKNVVQALQTIAPQFYNYPSLRLGMIGITGTNGKTTISYLLRAILQSQRVGKRSAHRVGLIGTIQHQIDQRIIVAHNTTPMVWEIQDLLHEMVEAGCDMGVMEVSSHALAENRIAGCEFDVAVFTNLTRDHLDYHKTMSQYAAAKRKLFSHLNQPGSKNNLKLAVINRDDTRADMMKTAAGKARIVTYALDQKADLWAENIKLTNRGSSFTLCARREKIKLSLHLLGRYNVQNALAAAAAAFGMGIRLSVIQKGLQSVHSVPGRVAKLPGSSPFAVVVDYAHTPDALEKVLNACREFTEKRVIVVFGCGGNRDKAKRVLMGAIAARMADEVIITSDNPRQEDPKKIIQAIGRGYQQVRKDKKPQVESDRARAIARALRMAQPGDTVLIAGKGHEHYQILKKKTIAFDDGDVAQHILTQLSRR
jgi:UDP-N-acetylmuramoyl-L-alanyl-D-glutamate--2,6-diaminopimelate ligase